MNGATADECLELLGLLKEYSDTCRKLQIECGADSQYYDAHFRGYRDYLLHRQLYDSYLDYIQRDSFVL